MPVSRKLPRLTCVALALSVVGLAITGCSNDSAAQQSKPSATASATASVQADDAVVNDTRYQCLLDHGFPVTRSEGGGVQFQDPDGAREEEYKQANRECDDSMAAAGLITTESTDDLRALYQKQSALHECLVEKGFPLLDFPTEEVFVEQEGAVNVLEATAPVELEDATKACPEQFAAANG